tara:strand:- start:25 stop:141 length:117 start_codon:yes stop_codon:yes gene_type:complete
MAEAEVVMLESDGSLTAILKRGGVSILLPLWEKVAAEG